MKLFGIEYERNALIEQKNLYANGKLNPQLIMKCKFTKF